MPMGTSITTISLEVYIHQVPSISSPRLIRLRPSSNSTSPPPPPPHMSSSSSSPSLPPHLPPSSSPSPPSPHTPLDYHNRL